MSSDEIFAAQMWSWPGPMLKRDTAGRVIIVNAAFLQMYGGRIEDWSGNIVTGWPAPQPPGVSSRFESRMPQPDGTETVYDWMECTLQDGSALAIARDVTSFIATAPAPAPMPATQPPVQAPIEAPPVVQEQAPPPAAPPPQAPPVAQTPAYNAAPPPAHDQMFEMPPQAPEIPAAAPPPMAQAPEIPATPPAPPAVAPPMAEAPAIPQAEATPPPAAPPMAPPVAQEPERDFERRALPIENGDAVLGNNWRDAVIAKAVGVEDTPQEEPAQSVQQGQPEAETTNAETDGIRILLAEDNAINALLTRTLLEAEGCMVEVVEDGSLAVEAVKTAPYDMIFMDMRMPNMDGLEATRKIRSMDHRSKGLPIVALTANAFDDDRNACFDSGMNDFMTKPVSAEELSQMVKTHTQKQAAA